MASSLNFTLYSGKRFFQRQDCDIKKLSKLCRDFVGLNYSIDIVQVEDEPRRAFLDGVSETPAIFIEVVGRRKENLGGFAAAEKYLSARWTEAQLEQGIATFASGDAAMTLA